VGIQFDNRVSWMDIASLLGAAALAMTIFFGVKEDVKIQQIEIDHLRSNISRVEVQAQDANRQILEKLREQNVVIKDIRTESAEGRDKIMEKLDRLIEREVPPRRGKVEE
jgi:Tfp pilus assembly protein PilN